MNASFTYPQSLHERLELVKPEWKSVSQFALEAFEEKINRMEKRDDNSRKLAVQRDLDALRPLFLALLKEVDRG